MNLKVLALLFCFGPGADAADPTRAIPQLPENPAPRDVTSYLQTLRQITNREPARLTYLPPGWRPPPINAALVKHTRAAFDRVLPTFLDLVLKECRTAENAWTKEQIDVYVQLPDGRTEFAGFREARVEFRTVFTRIALDRIAALEVLTEKQHQLLFEHLGTFPELMLGLIGRRWLPEIDPYLSPKLIRQIDRTTGWRGTGKFWIEALLKVDTPRSWQALETLLIEAPELRLYVYEAIKDIPAPKFDLDRAVAKAWKAYVEETSSGNRAIFAAIAARHGVRDAVVELAEYMQRFWEKGPPPRASAALRAVVAGEFSDAKELADFVAKNSRRLSFDTAARKFVLAPKR